MYRETAVNASGAAVTYASPTSDDAVDGSVPLLCAPESGSTFPIGTTIVTCSAEDSRGNKTVETFDVGVLYDFGNGTGGGFGSPISSSSETLNEVKAGAIVPAKFGLDGDFGLDILEQGYPVSRQMATSTCEEAAVNPIDVPATTTSGLKYDAAAGQYVYNWKTDRDWSSTCRQLVVKLRDGTVHAVNFKFG